MPYLGYNMKMQTYDEFMKTISEETKKNVSDLIASVSNPEIDKLGPIILVSKNPEDINKVRKVKSCWFKN